MRIGAIIVTYNTLPGDIGRLQAELEYVGNISPIIIDQSYSRYGYAHGVNIGIRKALKEGDDIFLVLNPDISIASIRYDTLIAGVRHFGIWGGVMKQHGITYYGGTIDPKRMSGGLNTRQPHTRFTPVDFVTGSFMVIHRSVIEKIGMWNESYGMYYEDVEFCYRANQHAIAVGIDTSMQYIHFERTVHSVKKEWYLAINRLRFLKQYGNRIQKRYELLRAPVTLIEYGVKLFLFLIQYPA